MASEIGAWMPLYIGDYLADTMHLSNAEHGAYLLLIMHYWRSGPLPDDDRALATIARTERKEWSTEIGPIVRKFFRATEGRLHHKRIDHELATAGAHVEQRRAAGRASAEARKRQRGTNGTVNGEPTAVATEGSTDDQRNGRPSPSPSPEEKSSELRSAPTAKDELFAEGLSVLQELTGKPREKVASLIGGWLKQAGNDHQRVLDVLRRAASERPVEPVGWIVGALRMRPAPLLGADDPLGAAAWIARQQTHQGTWQNRQVPCINGYPLEATIDSIVDAIAAAGGQVVSRPNLDALAGWCRDDLLADPSFNQTIRRVAGGLAAPVRSLAVFDQALREGATGRTAA